MNQPTTRRALVGAFAAAALLGAGPALAQQYPARPITVIVPFAAGGPTDVLARIVTQRMSRSLGQTMVVENVGGAGGTIGVVRGARAAPDGYTLTVGHLGTHVSNIALYRRLQYDPQTDFEPIAPLGVNPMILVAKRGAPATVPEFLAHVRANQERLSYGHAGIGSASHTAALMFHAATGTKVQDVAYRGTGPAMNDLVAGQFDYMIDQALNVLQQVQGGTVLGIAVTTPERLPQVPNLPTLAESGLTGFDVAIWNTLFAPKGTPQPILERLNAAAAEAMADPAIRTRLTELAVQIPSEAELKLGAFKARHAADVARWVPVIRAAGATAE
ncbi:MAG: tripartite tricarboxylate transporter substrate binding protein BugD [Alphaproteobacteria bacterium]|nr:tripartite tricarboxylate transporter substrate-binding protein [Alphaproteobacteria bacterium]TAD91559.1 MAG: tripartite tricarboxylate transporter substrate binding protein BugD [Alphaproteobacteria bacterium]